MLLRRDNEGRNLGPLVREEAQRRTEVLTHFTRDDLRSLCQAGSLTDRDARRLFHHLPSGCRTCWQQLEATRTRASQLPPTTSPIVAALRALTADDPDQLTPLQRLVRNRGLRWHLGFPRLVVDEALRLLDSAPRHAEDIDLGALLQLASRDLPREQRHDLFALDHIYETEVFLRAAEIDSAKASLTRALLQLMAGTGDPELQAAFTSAEARMWWLRDQRSTAAYVLKRAVEALAQGGAELDERRTEILNDQASYLSLDGEIGKARRALEEALAVLDGVEKPCPRLRLAILHNLATTEANLVLASADGTPVERLDFRQTQAYLTTAEALYEACGTPALRAQRAALLALGSGNPNRSFQTLYRSLVHPECACVGNPVDAAQAAFQLLEWLEEQEHRDAARELVEDLRQRLATSPAVETYFSFLSGRLHELAELGDLPAVPARRLRTRLELLALLLPRDDTADSPSATVEPRP